MDTVEIRVRLTYTEPLANSEYTDLVDRFLAVIEREVAPGGDLTFEEMDVAEFEYTHRRPADPGA